MCIFKKSQTIEELIAQNSAGMSDVQKAEYWWELSQTCFALLGKIDVPVYPISPVEWVKYAQAQYPALTDIKLPDSIFYATDGDGLKSILERDWTNLIPYVAELHDCDDFAVHLYVHLCLYYKITDVFPVWGDTTQGYHGFNLAVLKTDDGWVARLIEPQTDQIFVNQGPLGYYVPKAMAEFLGVVPIKEGG